MTKTTTTAAAAIPLTSSEVGNLWVTYQEQTMFLQFLEHFLEHAAEPESKSILQFAYNLSKKRIDFIKQIFTEEDAAIPMGFSENDVYKGTPKLFDFMYDTMFTHLIAKIEMSLFALYSGMSYRQDIRHLFKQMTADSQEIADQCARFLLKKGVLSRPPFMSMPKEVKFVSQDDDYLSGFHLFKENRALNAIEISLIHHAIETNLVGMQLMIGFAQVAKDSKVRAYMKKGMELSLKIETTLGEYLRKEYIEPPATPAGKATSSTTAPFSDKIMMYVTNLLTSFGLGSNALGGAFSLRSDLPLTMANLTKNIYPFAKEGGEIMIKNGWMEEPPQVEDRRKLTQLK